MKEKSDLSKILEGRCRGLGADYVAFKKANEAHSRGTATEVYDPVAQRTVHTLSMGEMYWFWILRYDEDVAEILEQFLLIPEVAAKAALKLGLPAPGRILTNDMLALYRDGHMTAYSIKASRRELDPDTAHGRAVIRRQALEKVYWDMLGVRFRIVFKDEMDRYRAMNISACMKYYDAGSVQTVDQMYKHLIAHHVIETDLSKPVLFAKTANENAGEIAGLFERRASYVHRR